MKIPLRLLIGLLLLASLGAGQAIAATCSVVLRVPAGSPLPAPLAPLLAHWRQSGQVSQVLFLTEGRPETAKDKQEFEALAVLEFSGEEALAAWQRDGASLLPASVVVRRADVLTHGELSPRDSTKSVFVVNVYTPTVERARYAEFVDGYIKPLYTAQHEGGNLVRSTMYHERGETGRVNSLAILEYRDATAFKAAGEEKLAIRARLEKSVPTYNTFHPIKDQLRRNDGGNFATFTPLAATAKRKNWPAPATRILAQALCDEIMAAHPELLSVTMQGRPPGTADGVYTMFAGSFPERIGNASDPDDVEVITKGITILDPRWRRPDPVAKFVVLTPLRDAQGGNIGLIVVAFKNDAAHARSEGEFYRAASQLRDGLQPRIADFAALFAPAGR